MPIIIYDKMFKCHGYIYKLKRWGNLNDFFSCEKRLERGRVNQNFTNSHIKRRVSKIQKNNLTYFVNTPLKR